MPVGFYNQTFATRHLSDHTIGYVDVVWDLQCASHCKAGPAVRSLFKKKKYFNLLICPGLQRGWVRAKKSLACCPTNGLELIT